MSEINKIIENKSFAEKVDIKSTEIAKTKLEKFNKEGFDIEIIGDIKKIEGGIEVFAKAFKEGKPVGFGKDGTIEIERFRFFNPPVLVEDKNGDIIRKVGIDKITKKEIPDRIFRYDPTEAIKQSLSHTILLVAKDGNNIVKNKVGNTTSTFYPDAGNPGTNSCDGVIRNNGVTYSTVHDAATGASLDPVTDELLSINSFVGGNYYVDRSVANFYTSAINTDTINSATFSIKHDSIGFSNANSDSVSLVTNSIVSDIAYAVADYDLFGTTKQATDIALSSLSNNTYADFSLNSTGIGNINKTGTTHFGVRSAGDVANSAPTGDNQARFFAADTAGTTSDPKLVVEHTVGSIIHLLSSTGVGR